MAPVELIVKLYVIEYIEMVLVDIELICEMVPVAFAVIFIDSELITTVLFETDPN